jgi:sugar phosphate isomerase/epimerase
MEGRCSLANSWENTLRLGTVHIMSYPGVQSGEQQFLDTFTALAEDDFFSLVELALVKDPTQRKAIRKLVQVSHLSITYAAQAALMGQKLDLNSLDDSERKRAVKEAILGIDEAYDLGAERMSLLSGPDPGTSKRNEATRALVGSLKEICAYGQKMGIAVALEAFDRDVEKKCLIGPAEEAAAVARSVRTEFPNFGILYDMAHGPLLEEDFESALTVLKNYLVHVHVGNCVKAAGNPAYGDKHPRFGVNGGLHDVEELTHFLQILFDVGYLGKKLRANEKLPIVGFEIKPLPGETPEAVLSSTKRVWRRSWAQLRTTKKANRG